MDGLRLLSDWRAARPDEAARIAPPEGVLACGQLGVGGTGAQFLLTVRLVPVGPGGRPFAEGTGLTAHVAVPADFDERTVDALQPDLEAVVSGLLGASAPARTPGVPPRTWRALTLALDAALQAARRRTLEAHNRVVREDRDRALRVSGPREAGEQLKMAAMRAREAILAHSRAEPHLRETPRGRQIKALLGHDGPLTPQNAWRLVTGHQDETSVELLLSRVAGNPRAFWHEAFDEIWAALFAPVIADRAASSGDADAPQLMPSVTAQTWHDLRIEVMAAAYVAG
jgi:hypothetical protein